MSVEVSKRSGSDTELVRVYTALGEPTRLRIVRLLAEQDGLTCGDVADRLGVTCSTLSHHLALLYDAGLLRMQKDGRFRVYRLDRDVLDTYAPAVASAWSARASRAAGGELGVSRAIGGRPGHIDVRPDMDTFS